MFGTGEPPHPIPWCRHVAGGPVAVHACELPRLTPPPLSPPLWHIRCGCPITFPPHRHDLFLWVLRCVCGWQVQLLVEEMRRHCADFHRVAATGSHGHELGGFWLRKTRKPVLSVLMVKKGSEPPRFYRGVNMEVRPRPPPPVLVLQTLSPAPQLHFPPPPPPLGFLRTPLYIARLPPPPSLSTTPVPLDARCPCPRGPCVQSGPPLAPPLPRT
jgi:hypothetical protein